jgi:hypothetical protein
LQVRLACSSAPLIYRGGTLFDIGGTTSITLPAAASLQFVTGPDRLIGFGDTYYRGTTEQYFTPFVSLSDFTVQLANTPDGTAPSATYGFSDRGGLCFFAAGLPATAATAIASSYVGRLDGLHQFDAFTQRLFPSKVTATMDPVSGTGTIALNLASYSSPFTDFSKQTAGALLPITANLAVNGTHVTANSVTGFPGYTGAMSGELVGQRGMALVFELHNAAGDVIWGAIALDDPSCKGCWDF